MPSEATTQAAETLALVMAVDEHEIAAAEQARTEADAAGDLANHPEEAFSDEAQTIGIGLAFVRDSLDRRLRDSTEIQETFAGPTDSASD